MIEKCIFTQAGRQDEKRPARAWFDSLALSQANLALSTLRGDGAGDKVKYDNGIEYSISNFTLHDPEDRFYLAGEDEPWDPYRDGRSLEVRADYCGCGEPMTFMEAS